MSLSQEEKRRVIEDEAKTLEQFKVCSIYLPVLLQLAFKIFTRIHIKNIYTKKKNCYLHVNIFSQQHQIMQIVLRYLYS